MTIQEIEQKLREMDDEFKLGYNELLKALAELKESKKEGKWKPTCNEVYIYRGDHGSIRICYWADTEIDNWRYNNLPIFKTAEQCKKYWNFMDTVKEKSYEFSCEELEDTHIAKYFIKYDFDNKEFAVDGHRFTKVFNAPYFKTEEDAQYIIDNFKDELTKYWI